jgi:hypothetical protein
VFVPTANPIMSVRAIPGPFATPGFAAPITLDARTLPGLTLVAMDEQLYTSKAHWEEGIVLALPKTGETNTSGQTEYNLKQGDVIEVTVAIPSNNTVDLFLCGQCSSEVHRRGTGITQSLCHCSEG